VVTFDVTNESPGVGARHVGGDLLDRRKLDDALPGVDTIVHLAAKHRFFGVTPEEFQRVNVDGTRVLLEAASDAGIQRFVFYSSVAVYGDQPATTTESTVPTPDAPYGKTKLAAEGLVKAWAAAQPGRVALIIRPTVVFGPGNRGNIYRLIRQIDRGLFVRVGEGNNVKSIAYVDNLVAATLFLMRREPQASVDIFNYADEPHLSFREIVELIHQALGRRMPSFVLPVGPVLAAALPVEKLITLLGKDVPIRTAIEKINRVTHHSSAKLKAAGFVAPHPIESGLNEMIAWYKAAKTAPRLAGSST
jgi:nucleoside-diphosphate-sugar epimerase